MSIRSDGPWPSIGRVVFAATLSAFGLWGLTHEAVAPIWEAIPRSWPMREALGHLSAAVPLASGAGLFFRRPAPWAAGVFFAYLLVWMLVFKAPAVVQAPATAVVWESCGETAVLVAASWMLFARLAEAKAFLRPVVGEAGQRGAAVLYGAALIAFGLAHFAYLRLTAGLVPAWLPAHAAWAAFTGSTYGLAGVAMIVTVLPRLAAALSTLQIGAFTLPVWVPKLAMGHPSPSDGDEAAPGSTKHG